MSRHVLNALSAAAAVLLLLILLRVVWSPDPAQSLFLRAQQLETAGQIPLALRHYAMISGKHPESFYAPRALLRQGDLLVSQGLQSGETPLLRQALMAYSQLSQRYPTDPLAIEALLDAGKLAAESLGDRAAAKGFYATILERSGAKSDAAATATVKLGRLAIADGDKNLAQQLLQRVLRNWPGLPDRAAEAQFELGVAYETLWKNKEWATRAYEATITHYPASTWANDARGRLGLIQFVDARGKRPARRVLISIEPLPDEGNSDGSLWSVLRPLLAAHGIAADATLLRGWSLAPFYAAFDPKNPARVVSAPFDAWENVVANAGLRFTVKSGGKEAEALRDLRDEIDSERAPLVYFETTEGETTQGIWALCIGYDSERDEVMLQSRGARFDTLSSKSFAALWKAKSKFGQSYTMLSLVPAAPPARRSTGKMPAPKSTPNGTPNLTPTPAPTTKPGATPTPDLMTVPAFVWELPRLSAPAAERRVARRAAALLVRRQSGGMLLNIEALSYLSRELSRLAQAPTVPILPNAPSNAEAAATQTPAAETASPDAVSPDATPEITPGATPDATPESAYVPAATATPTAPPISAPNLATASATELARTASARRLLGFFGPAAQRWIDSRRDAAAWCDEAAARLKDSRWKQAAQNFRTGASALETAVSLVPADLSAPLGSGDRAQLGEVARAVARARDAERAAAITLQ